MNSRHLEENGRKMTVRATNNNAVFLGGISIFFIVFVLPVLLNALYKAGVLVLVVLMILLVTNPSDSSFAWWLNNQDNIYMQNNSKSVVKWLSTLFRVVKNEAPSWIYFNVIIFSVVHIPSINRYAFGILGHWQWVDDRSRLLDLCTSEYIKSLSNGGSISSMEKYVKSSNPTTLNDEAMRHAMHLKIKKEWIPAYEAFKNASVSAESNLMHAQCLLQSARCLLESKDISRTKEAKSLILEASGVYSSSGRFEESADALCELAIKLKTTCSASHRSISTSKKIAKIYTKAGDIYEAGSLMSRSTEARNKAASLYAEIEMWSAADEIFHRTSLVNFRDGNESTGVKMLLNSFLCKIALFDVVGAETTILNFKRKFVDSRISRDAEEFMQGLLSAYNQWSVKVLGECSKAYEMKYGLCNWQKKSVDSLRKKLSTTDLR